MMMSCLSCRLSGHRRVSERCSICPILWCIQHPNHYIWGRAWISTRSVRFHHYHANSSWVAGHWKLCVPIDLRGDLYNSYSCTELCCDTVRLSVCLSLSIWMYLGNAIKHWHHHCVTIGVNPAGDAGDTSPRKLDCGGRWCIMSPQI